MAAGNMPGIKSHVDTVALLKLQCLDESSQDIVFVDVPGFDDRRRSDVETLKMIAGWLKEM